MSELRYDPIQARWVIIATDRSRRPHDLEVAAEHPQTRFCPFCPGHESRTPPEIAAIGRPAGAARDGEGWQVRVVPNKYPALSVEGDLERRGVGLYDRMRGVGAHEVVIDSPDHDAGWAELAPAHLARLLRLVQERMRDLFRDRRLQYVLPFKNHGAAAGATLAHPHTQIIATPVIPRIVGHELSQARAHHQRKERCLFCDVLDEERERGERLVRECDRFVAFAPYASRFPFELMIMPRRHGHDFAAAGAEETEALAACLVELCRRLKLVLNDPPFNLVIHSSPNREAFSARPDDWQTLHLDYHWHVELLPRLSRVAGFENGTDFYINPTAPEEAARYLREASG
jgi:UDPglucose--hexose-1-phosphate uridylyltransferase